MKRWLRRVRGALGLGFIWGLVGFVTGVGIEVVHNLWPNPIGAAVDIWPAVLAYPGFLGGVAFSTVLGIAGRNRRFAELSTSKIATWGAIGGVAVSLIPIGFVAVGAASTSVPIWEFVFGLTVPCALGGAAAASASLALARRAEESALLRASENLSDLGLTAEESRELLGDDG